MDALTAQVMARARRLGAQVRVAFDPRVLVPEERIRELCYENRCGNYGAHYMCPPHIGTVEELKTRLATYRRGVLLQYSQPLDMRNDREGLRRTKTELQHIVLQLEDFVRGSGIDDAWGLMAGSCALCDVCTARLNQPCPYPEKARPSLESLAVDVLGLLDGFGLDSAFHPDSITWTGCVLF